MNIDKVTCDICKRDVRAVQSHINLICKSCQKKEKQELIGEFLEDLKLTHPMIGFKYTRLELIEKWEDKL